MLRSSALGKACGFGPIELVKFLLDRDGLDINCSYGSQPALWHAVNRGDADIVKLLLERGADPTLPTESYTYGGPHRIYRAPITLAARRGVTKIVELLVECGADVNETLDDYTPLCLACHFGHKEVLELLLESKKINVEIKSKTRSRGGRGFRLLSPLACVARIFYDIWDKELSKLSRTNATHQGCCYEIIELLLKRGADVNSKGSSGYTPLMWLFDGYGLGSMSFNIEIVKLFLAQKDIDII
jgi:ankyrin repeat protein